MISLDLTLQLMVTRFLAGLVIIIVQGAAIASIAHLLGDKGPRYDGRMTLLPSSHLDLLGLGTLVLTGFGWSRPVAIDANEMRVGRWGLVLATLGSSLALLVIGRLVLFLVIPALTTLPHTTALLVAAFLRNTAQLCVWAALLALVPLPPLPGAHILAALGIRLPAVAGTLLGWLLLVVSLLGFTRLMLAPAYQYVAAVVIGS